MRGVRIDGLGVGQGLGSGMGGTLVTYAAEID